MRRKKGPSTAPRFGRLRSGRRKETHAITDPRDGTIFGLFIHPDYEGRGLGQVLLPLACEDVRAAGFVAATLTTGPGTRAERFYRTNGWEEIGRQDDGEIIFRKAL